MCNISQQVFIQMHNPQVTSVNAKQSTINLTCGRQLGENIVQKQHKQLNQTEKPQRDC